MKRPLALGFLLSAFATSGCATSPAVSAPGLSLRKVVIYRNGVGYFERSGKVRGDRVAFQVRKEEIGDFLATLAVLERGGSSVRAASFPLDVKEETSPAPPPPVPPPQPWQGETATALPPSRPATPGPLRTVVMSLDGLEHDLQVGYIAESPVWRPSYRLVIEKDGAHLQTWGIVQNLSGEDWKDVSLSLVAEAPLAFDASLANPVIPPRPKVTDGGDVIAVVPHAETSLAAGVVAPAAPPQAPPPAEPAPAPMAKREAEERKVMRFKKGAVAREKAGGAAVADEDAAPAMSLAAPAPAYSRETRQLSALAAIATQSGATRYDLPNPVSVPDKSATMVMLLDRTIPGEAVALFAPDEGVPDSAAHPFRVARYVNKTGGLLEKGPLAIFAEGAFAGQGMADPLPDGATATVPFALERAVAVDVSRESREEGARLAHIEGGILTINRDAVALTKYRAKNGGERAVKLLLRHPRIPGARLQNPPAGVEDNVGTGSALVPAMLAGRATVEVVVDEREESGRAVDWLDPLAEDAVQAYVADRRADPVVVAGLKAAWELRRVLKTANDEKAKLEVEQEQLARSSEETRENLKSLQKIASAADLRAKLSSRLAADAARLDKVSKRLIELNVSVSENQVRFNEALRSLKLSAPLPPA